MEKTALISVIVPVHNGASTLARCLDALRASTFPPYELVVVDDGSQDDSSRIAASHGCAVAALDRRRGPAAARNHGAQVARGDILLFTDADVVLPPDALWRIAHDFEAHPEVSAVQGMYRCPGPWTNPSSRYQNDYYHYFCRRIPGDYTSVFATWCAAIRRSVFWEVGGFDERIPYPSVEDEEFGYELVDRGHKILLDRGLLVDHLARYTLSTLLRRRYAMAVSQMKSAIRKAPSRLFRRYANLGRNLTHHSRRILLAIPTAYLVALLLAAAVFDPRAGLYALAAAGVFVLLTAEFLRFVVRTHGWRALPATVGLMWLDMLAVGAGLVAGAIGYLRGEKY